MTEYRHNNTQCPSPFTFLTFMLVMKKIDPVNQSIVWVDVGVVIRFTSSCVSAKENIPDTDKVDTVPSKYGPVLPVAPVFAANPGIPWTP